MEDRQKTHDIQTRMMEISGTPKAIDPLTQPEPTMPFILSFVVDWANIVTLLGLSSGVLAMVFALQQNYPAAIIAMLWAVLLDWFDGVVARKMPGRSEWHKLIGGHMDTLVDLFCLAVVPATLLLSLGDFSPWVYPGALAIIMAGVLRLSYFDVFGVDKKGTYAGVTLDNSPIVVSAIFFLESFLSHNPFVVILYAAILVMAFLHVAPIRTPKVGRIWYYVFTAYVVMATGGYSYILQRQ